MPDRTPVTLDLSIGSILRFFGLIILLLFLWSVMNVIGIVLFSVIIAAAIVPAVDFLHRRRVPRGLGIALIYLLIIAFIVLVVVLFGQLLSDQIRELAANFPSYYSKASSYFLGASESNPAIAQTVQRWLQSLNSAIVNLTQQVALGTFSLFGGVFTFVGIFVLSFYMVLQKDSLKQLADNVAPAHLIPYLYQLIDRIIKRLGGWVRGQMLLSLIIGATTYFGLLVLGVDYTIALALIAGISELIPFIGPFIGAIPAVLVAFGQSPLLALIVVLMYLGIQQLENNLIVPNVMKRTTGLNPIVVIIVMLIGGKLAGAAGVILAIPLTLIIDSFFEDFFKENDATGSTSQPEGNDV